MKNINTQLITITSYDGYPIQAKIRIPDILEIDKIVIYVNGSGPNTYDNKRDGFNGATFNYHDLFSEQFCNRGIAYCSYNTRGVIEGNEGPLYVKIDDEEYKKYLPHNSVEDVIAIVKYIKQQPLLKNTKIFLLGWSEGTIIAPIVAMRKDIEVDALLLAGYCNENLKDTLVWQLSGNAEYINWSLAFDYDNKGYITRENFHEDKYKVRTALFGNATFDDIDSNHDGKIDIDDAAARSLPHLENMLTAIDRNDDQWLKRNNGVRLTSAWLKEHFSLKPTKEILPLLDLPIVIFQGDIDRMCPKSYADDIKRKFEALGRHNLTVNIFKKHDHDLNYAVYLMRNEISEGLLSIFQTAKQM